MGRFAQAGKSERFTTYYADVHPWLWLLTMKSDSRIFQNKSTPDIVKQVFSDLGFTDFKDSLTGTYQPRRVLRPVSRDLLRVRFAANGGRGDFLLF